MAAWYLPAAEETAVGGDWYDVIELGHRRLGLTVGDMAGHGIAAATYMGQLRSAVRAYALDIERPSEVVRKLARFADLEKSRMATMIYATINLDTWVVDLRARGAPLPAADQPRWAADLPQRRGRAAHRRRRGRGVRRAADHSGTRRDPAPLHGWADRAPGTDPVGGRAALTEAAIAAPDEPELTCRVDLSGSRRGSTSWTTSPCSPSGRSASTRTLEVEVPAEAGQLATVRHLIRRWVTANGGTDDDCAAFAIAVTRGMRERRRARLRPGGCHDRPQRGSAGR